MRKIWGVVCVVMLALVLVMAPMGTAMADNQKGPYVGLFAGYVIPSDLKVEEAGEASTDLSLDNSYNLGIKAGYIFPQAPYIAVELEYNYNFAADVDTQVVTTDAGTINVTGDDVKVSALMANLIFRYPHEMFRPYIGFGIGWAWGEFKLTGTAGPETITVDESDNDWAWQFLVGVNFAFAKNWSADIGYRYFAAENFSYSDEASNVDVKYKNSTILVGINYHF